MTVANLIEELETQPPDAEVLITGEVMCDHEDHQTHASYVNVEVVAKVVGVRSTHPRLVMIEVRE